jgi:hypothetical protein
MASSGFNIPDSLRDLFANVKLEDLTSAIKNITLADFTHLIDVAKGRELNAETITKLYEEASKLNGAGSALMAAALVILIIIFCFPMAAATPVLTFLGFTNIGPAAGIKFRTSSILALLTCLVASLVAAFQSAWGVNALFSLLQSAAMGGYGVPYVAGAIKGASALGAAKVWAMGNFTLRTIFEAMRGPD